MVGLILLVVCGIVSLICWIMILVKMFKTEQSPVPGIIGIFCSLWAFIWGWMNSGKLGLKKLMLIWTVAIIGSVAGNGIYTAQAIKAGMQQQPSLELPSQP